MKKKFLALLLTLCMALRLPLFRRKLAERRQVTAVFPAHFLELPQSPVDLAAFHIGVPFPAKFQSHGTILPILYNVLPHRAREGENFL